MNTQKTAVEWLLDKVWDLDDENFTVPNRLIEMIEQAKEIEKQQIIKAFNEAENRCEYFIEEHKYNRYYETSELYYNHTYIKQ